jgi:hypothetical protein
MDQFLKVNYGQCHTLNFAEFPTYEPPIQKSKPCFFPVTELETEKRHLTLMRGQKWYDYTAHKEFQTIEEWIHDCKITKEQIRFGYNRFDGRNSSISLNQLLQKLNYQDELCQFMTRLSLNGHTLQENVLVRTTEQVQTYLQYMQ